MMTIHTQRRGLCGVYPQRWPNKVSTVEDGARDHGFPLRAGMKPE